MIVGLDGARQRDTSGRIVEWSSPDDKCTQCMTDRYLNPKLRLLVGPCFHKMCESCIDRIFFLGPAPCPVCGTIVRKNEFASQTFEDLDVEREVVLRQQISKICFRNVDDFGGDVAAYNDYLDKVETVTYNLVHHIDEENARGWIEDQKAASRGGAGAHERSALRETELSAQIDAMQREERLAKRARLVALDERERKDKAVEAKDTVRLLEEGLITPAEMAQRQADATERRRLERERDEAAVEQEFAERAEHKVASLVHAASASSSKKAKSKDAHQSGQERLWGPRGFKAEMLTDLSGPLAALHDAREWIPRHAPYAPAGGRAATTRGAGRSDADMHMANLWRATHPRPLGAGAGAAGQSVGFPLDELARMRAGGFNWYDTLRSEHQAGIATVGYLTPEVYETLQKEKG